MRTITTKRFVKFIELMQFFNVFVCFVYACIASGIQYSQVDLEIYRFVEFFLIIFYVEFSVSILFTSMNWFLLFAWNDTENSKKEPGNFFLISIWKLFTSKYHMKWIGIPFSRVFILLSYFIHLIYFVVVVTDDILYAIRFLFSILLIFCISSFSFNFSDDKSPCDKFFCFVFFSYFSSVLYSSRWMSSISTKITMSLTGQTKTKIFDCCSFLLPMLPFI